MIHTTILMKLKSKRTAATSRYWTVKIPRKDVLEYISARKKLEEVSQGREDISLTINGNKYFSRICNNDMLLIFITDIDERDRLINQKIDCATEGIEAAIKERGISFVRKNYERIVSPFVHSRLKIALVGEGGVGKTTTLHLLMGKVPPKQYVPTIALNLEVMETIYFANYSLVIWDFAGQERFRKLWKFYFKGADIVFLLTDSTLRNVLLSKEMFTVIRRDAPNVPIIVIANKQDLPNALDPSIIRRIIGAETYPLVAIDLAYREKILKILLDVAAEHVKITVPEAPPEELLRFVDDEYISEEVEAAEVQ